MAVLSRPPSRHVRRPGQAIAIVDLADDGGSLPPVSRRSRGRARAIAAGIGAVIGVAASVAPIPPARAELAASLLATAAPVMVPPAASIASAVALTRRLALPLGVSDADLSAMPDRYVNESLPASFRIVVSVRGHAGIASVDPPSTIVWTEGDLHYLLTSSARTVPQLVELASRLR